MMTATPVGYLKGVFTSAPLTIDSSTIPSGPSYSGGYCRVWLATDYLVLPLPAGANPRPTPTVTLPQGPGYSAGTTIDFFASEGAAICAAGGGAYAVPPASMGQTV